MLPAASRAYASILAILCNGRVSRAYILLICMPFCVAAGPFNNDLDDLFGVPAKQQPPMSASPDADNLLAAFEDSSISSSGPAIPSACFSTPYATPQPASQSRTGHKPADDLLGGFEGSLGRSCQQATPFLQSQRRLSQEYSNQNRKVSQIRLGGSTETLHPRLCCIKQVWSGFSSSLSRAYCCRRGRPQHS